MSSNRPSYLEDDDPSEGDVVKVDGSFVRVAEPRVAPGVVLVPVHAQARHAEASVGCGLGAQAQRLAVQDVVFVQAARPAALAARWHVPAGHDAVVDGQRTDERTLILLVCHVVWPWQTDARRAVGAEREDNNRKKLKSKLFKEPMKEGMFTQQTLMGHHHPSTLPSIHSFINPVCSELDCSVSVEKAGTI